MDDSHQEIARGLFRESNDALFLFDPDDHRVVDLNPAALRLTGFDKPYALTLRLGDLFTSAEPGGLSRLVESYRRTGFSRPRDGYFLATDRGEPIAVNVGVSRIHTAPGPTGLIVVRDIRERLRAQEAIRASEERYRGLVESAGLLVWSVDPEGRVVSANPAFAAIAAGIGVEVGPGSRWIEGVDPADRGRAIEAFARAGRGDPVAPIEIRLVGPGGEVAPIELLSAAVQGTAPGVVSAIARDLSERDRAAEATRRAEAMRQAKEAAEAADRAKGAFLAQVGHELRTPLTAILGFNDLILEDPRTEDLPSDLRENVRAVRRNADHLLDLIGDVLDLTRIEMGRLRVDPVPCPPAAIAAEVVASIRPRAEARGLSIAATLAPELPDTIRTDPVRLRQILHNLLANAAKFTHRGGIRLDVAPGDGLPGGGPSIRFAVVDTGVGVSEAEATRLFEAFHTTEATTGRDAGAGLGLAISRGLATLLGGRIDFTSRPGLGSTFALTIPVGEPEPTAIGTSAPRPQPNDRATGPLVDPASRRIEGRILLAEDHEEIRRYLAIRLRLAGAVVAIAVDGREAIDLGVAALEAGTPFDWILMDVQMPGVDGYEATRTLRDRGYRGPIIALTAYASEAHRAECLAFGCDDHLSKPVEWDRLLATLEALRPAPVEVAATGST